MPGQEAQKKISALVAEPAASGLAEGQVQSSQLSR